MKILVLSRYGNLGASSRYRSYQYFPYLRQQGWQITVAPLLDNDYVQNIGTGRKTQLFKIAGAYIQRISLLLQSKKYDLIWLEKEIVPYIPAWFESLLFISGVSYVVDYDDAIFHQYDQHNSIIVRQILGQKINQVMRRSALVIAGNEYLAQRAKKAGAKKVEILPTVIDLERYPVAEQAKNDIYTIGWIGSPSTCIYLKQIQPALQKICQEQKARVVAIGSTPLNLEGVPLEIKSWSEATEVKEMQQFDVGIMPLPDSPWTRGKCGFKLIQYMACKLPVIGSPVGVNRQIITQGINGFQANSQEDWLEAFEKLRYDVGLRRGMGEAGRAMVEKEYCLQVTAPKLANLLSGVRSI